MNIGRVVACAGSPGVCLYVFVGGACLICVGVSDRPYAHCAWCVCEWL
jgi:hypothetical protein